MSAQNRVFLSRWVPAVTGVLMLMVSFACASATNAQQNLRSAASSAEPSRDSSHTPLRAGSILPVILRTTLSSKIKTGQAIHGEIAQDVPLPDGSKIRRGSRIEGEVTAVSGLTAGSSRQISLRFNKLWVHDRGVPVTTNLRAIAGFMEVLDAQTPVIGGGESDVYNWLPTQQVGGDYVFGVGGTVASAHDTHLAVGKSLMSGGVLVSLSANSEGGCRGPLDGNDTPQPLWVFSSDACGSYGLSGVSIRDAGRSDPAGTIVLELQNSKASIRNGAGLLLRVLD